MNRSNIFLISIALLVSSVFIFNKLNPKTGGYPKIIGDENCIKITNETLSYIKEKSLSDYNIVLKNIGVIECKKENSGVFVWEKPPRFTVGYDTYTAGKTWYAGAILHDSCHVVQYKNKKSFNGEMAEKECLQFQEQAMTRISAPENEIETVRESVKLKYWEIPYDERTW